MITLQMCLAELDVDLDDRNLVLDLAAVGATRIAWRIGPVKDWHSEPGSRIDQVELARATVSVTRDIRTTIGKAQGRPPVSQAFARIADEIADLDRRLPDGRSVGEFAPDANERRRFVEFVRSAERRWAGLASVLGADAVLQMLACSAGWRARHWWGTPWWPARVDRFVDHVDIEKVLKIGSGSAQETEHERGYLRCRFCSALITSTRRWSLGVSPPDSGIRCRRSSRRCRGAGSRR